MDLDRRRVLGAIGAIGGGIGLAGCREVVPGSPTPTSTDAADRVSGPEREALLVVGGALRDAGTTLREEVTGFDSIETLASAGERLRGAASELGTLEEEGVTVSETVVALERMGDELDAATALLPVDPEGAGEALERFARLLWPMGTDGEPALASAAEGVAASVNAAAVHLRAVGESHTGEVRRLMEALSVSEGTELADRASELLAIEDPDLREVFELDDADVIEGLQLFVEDPARAVEMGAEITPEAWTAGAEAGFTEAIVAAGSQLRVLGGVVTGLAFYLTLWQDECSPVGSKSGCNPTGRFEVVRCAVPPATWRNVQRVSRGLGQGRLVVKGYKAIFKLTSPLDIFIECGYLHCEDTPCLPFEATDLEWVSRTTPIRVVNTKPSGPCWMPMFHTVPADLNEFRRALRTAKGACTSCSFC